MEERAREEEPTGFVQFAGQNWKRTTSRAEDVPYAKVLGGEKSWGVKGREGSLGGLEPREQWVLKCRLGPHREGLACKPRTQAVCLSITGSSTRFSAEAWHGGMLILSS